MYPGCLIPSSTCWASPGLEGGSRCGTTRGISRLSLERPAMDCGLMGNADHPCLELARIGPLFSHVLLLVVLPNVQKAHTPRSSDNGNVGGHLGRRLMIPVRLREPWTRWHAYTQLSLVQRLGRVVDPRYPWITFRSLSPRYFSSAVPLTFPSFPG